MCSKCLLAERIAFRLNNLGKFRVVEETRIEQIQRIGKKVIAVTNFFAIPIFSKYFAYMYFLIQYGPIFFSSHLIETIVLIYRLIRTVDKISWTPDMPIAIYYMMAENRGKEELELGNSFFDYKNLAKYCSLAINIGYEWNVFDAQRLLRLQGYELVLAETVYIGKFRDCGHNFFLATCGKEAVLVLPGTRDLSDIATDVNAFEKTLVLFGTEYKVHEGVCRKAQNLFFEIGPVLRQYEKNGFTIKIVGHSLGAAIASILTLLLNSSATCYAFGSPPCVDGQLAKLAEPMITNVVLRDDIVCRATVGNMHKLVSELTEKKTVSRFRKYMGRDFENFRNFFSNKIRDPNAQIGKIDSTSWWESIMSKKDEMIGMFKTRKVEEKNLKKGHFFLPGKIVYISKSGPAFWVGPEFIDSTCKLQTGMLRDHLGENYLRAIRDLGVKKVRKKNSEKCACCGCDFLWHSVLKGEPHIFLAQHECIQCARAVCGPCRKDRQCDACRARL